MTDSQGLWFLTLHGVPVQVLDAEQTAFLRDPQGGWIPTDGDHSYEVEEVCVRLHDALAAAIFGDLQLYYSLLPGLPEFVQEAGLNSESPVSRELFEQFVTRLAGMPHLNEALYLYDCRKLVSAIQECSKEVTCLVGEFYRILNLDELFSPPVAEPDGVRWVTSPAVTNLTATLNIIFIRLHSLLDYTTKLAFEVGHLRRTFTAYPKLASSNILFGNRRRVGWGEPARTLFEPGEPMAEIELVRNFVIHDGLLDDMPKAYKVVKEGVAVDKYVLMPDRTGGRFDRLKNRTLFYSREDRINLRLPALVRDFQYRLKETLSLALAHLQAKSAKGK